MYATHLHPRRALMALMAATLAALAIAVPGRLAAGDLDFGGGAGNAAPGTAAERAVPVRPQWIKDPLASPLRGLQAPMVSTY